MGFCTTLEVDEVYYYICWRLKLNMFPPEKNKESEIDFIN